MTRDVEFEIGAEVSPLKQKLREAGDAVKMFAREGESNINGMVGPLGALQEKFVAVGAILAGGAVFQQAVETTANYTKESINLGRALGISATEASSYIAALEDVDVSQEEFVGAAKALSKELKNNEGDLQAMGLKTRDAAGNLRPLNELTVEAVEIVGQYKEGTDRAIASQVLFGKKFELTSNLIELNSQTVADNAELQRTLASIVGQESVEAWGAFDSAGDKAALTLKAVKIAIGNALMPVLTDLANWFVAIGPAAITIIRGALGGLVAMFHAVTTGVTVLWETINAMVVSVAEPIRGVVLAMSRAMSGDLEGAGEAIAGIGKNIAGAWGNAFDVIAAKAQGTRDRIWNLFADGTPSAPSDQGGKSAAGLVKPDKEKKARTKREPAEQSMVPYYEAALSEEKRLASEKDALREYTKAEELTYWQTLLDNATMSAKDRMAVEKKVADLTVQVRREAAKEAAALDAESARHKEVMALGAVDAARAAAQTALELEQITKTQMAALEIKHEGDRYAVQKAGVADRLRLAELDPNTSPVELARIKNQLLEIEQQHENKLTELRGGMLIAQRQEAQEALQVWSDLGSRMSGLWDKGITAMMQGTLNWRNGFRAVTAEMVAWFAKDVVGKQVMLWAAGEAKKFAIKMGWLSAEQAAQGTASAAVVGIKAAEATAVTAANAVEAGTGAAASQAPIPIIGPGLALASMAAIFAAVMAMGGKMKSARRGYDIPKGINPMVQTHEEEMILPSGPSKALRQLAAMADAGQLSGAGAGSTYAPTVNVQTFAPRDMVRELQRNGAVAKAIAQSHRNFVKG